MAIIHITVNNKLLSALECEFWRQIGTYRETLWFRFQTFLFVNLSDLHVTQGHEVDTMWSIFCVKKKEIQINHYIEIK